MPNDKPVAKFHLTDINVTHIAWCSKGAVPVANNLVLKSADVPEGHELISKTFMFKTDEVKKEVYTYALEPDKPDFQGDVPTAEDVEKAQQSFSKALAMQQQDGQGTSDNHISFGDLGFMIQTAIDKDGALGKAYDLDPVPGGWFLGLKPDDSTWDKLQKGEYKAISIGGTAKRIPIESQSANKSDSDSYLQKAIGAVQRVLKGDGDAKTFNEIKAEENWRQKLWDTFWAFQDSVMSIAGDDTVEDKQAMVAASFDEFKPVMLAFFAANKSMGESAEQTRDLVAKIAAVLEPLTPTIETLKSKYTDITGGEDMGISAEDLKKMTDGIDELKTTVTGLGDRIGAIEEARKAADPDANKAADDASKDDLEKQLEKINKSLGEIGDTVKEVGERVKKLEDTPDLSKSNPPDNPDKLSKSEPSSPEEKDTEVKQTIGRSLMGGGKQAS